MTLMFMDDVYGIHDSFDDYIHDDLVNCSVCSFHDECYTCDVPDGHSDYDVRDGFDDEDTHNVHDGLDVCGVYGGPNDLVCPRRP